MDKSILGKFLAELREEKGLTQDQLAEMLNLNYKTISKWECGNTTPDLITLMKLAEIYEVSLYEFSIGKRIENLLISKNNIRKIINKNSIRKFIVLKIILIILSTLFFVGTIYSITYTINNYNTINVYELKGSDEILYVTGFFIKTHNEYYLSITSIKYINNQELFLNDKTNEINYSLTFGSYKSKYKQIKFESQTQIEDALSMLNFNIIGELLNENINHFFINIKYRNEKNEDINKSFKIILDKKFSNTKLRY